MAGISAYARLSGKQSDSLDAAWREAEAALPKGPWMLEVVREGAINGAVNPFTGYIIDEKPDRYIATAGNTWSADEGFRAGASSPAAALRALAAKLREVER